MGRTDSAITICLPKFLWGHKNTGKLAPFIFFPSPIVSFFSPIVLPISPIVYHLEAELEKREQTKSVVNSGKMVNEPISHALAQISS